MDRAAKEQMINRIDIIRQPSFLVERHLHDLDAETLSAQLGSDHHYRRPFRGLELHKLDRKTYAHTEQTRFIDCLA